jgi:ribosomal subunit interface protein
MKQTLSPNINTTPEVRAFIYQQLTDLEGLLPQGSNVNIVVEDPALLSKAKKPKIFKKKVMIQLETEAGNIVVESEHKDVFKAISLAKETLRGQLTTLESFLGGAEDRDQKIEDILAHKILH